MIPGRDSSTDRFRHPSSPCRIPHGKCRCGHSRTNPSTPADSASDTDSDISTLPDCSCNESWLVTPPPCFTKGGTSPEEIAASPLEDLLIEHPSMSVYVNRGQLPLMPRDRDGSTGTASQSSDDSELDVEPTQQSRPTVCNPRHPRVTRLSLQAQNKNICKRNKSHASPVPNRNACYRANMLRQLKTSGRNQRQHQHVIQPASRSFSKRC